MSQADGCKECGTESKSDFSKSQWKRLLKGWIARCKSCVADCDRLRKYNMSPKGFHKMMRKQNDQCAVCDVELEVGSEDKNKEPQVDHDHKTDVVRGILCLNCNTGIGKFKDSPELCKRAAKYLLVSKALSGSGGE
jgi:hypothetical protein